MYQTTPNDTCLDEVCFNCYHRCVSLILALRVEYPSLQSREEKLVDSLVAWSKETLCKMIKNYLWQKTLSNLELRSCCMMDSDSILWCNRGPCGTAQTDYAYTETLKPSMLLLNLYRVMLLRHTKVHTTKRNKWNVMLYLTLSYLLICTCNSTNSTVQYNIYLYLFFRCNSSNTFRPFQV